ncbi:MAG: amidase, partial [Actinomycetes bacterium]
DDEIARLAAPSPAPAVRRGDLTAATVVAAAIARTERLDPVLAAVVTPDFERALARARTGVPGPFGGVPTFIKDNEDVEGLPTRQGTAALATAPPATRTAPVAGQIQDMGLVCLGKSSLPEFGFTPSAEFPDGTPSTRNPWNTDHTAGGSSSGSAALVAAGVVPVAHGVDGGGSIRIPAACCGLVGLKPSRGRLAASPDARLLPVDILGEGLLTRSVRDTARYLFESERRYANPRLPTLGLVERGTDRPLRLGLVEASPNGNPVDTPTLATLHAAVALLESLGHVVEPVTLPGLDEFERDFKLYWAALAFSVSIAGPQLYGKAFDTSRLSDLTRGLATRFRSDLRRAPGAVRRLRASTRAVAPVYGSVDLVMSPVTNTVAPPLGHLATTLPFDQLFPRVEDWVGFTPLANATGEPSISLPLGHDPVTNLPVGVMFTGPGGAERLLLQLALDLEAAAPFRTLSP